VPYGSTSGANDVNNNNHPLWAHPFIVVFLPLRPLAAPNLFRTIDPCHGSIVQKRSGGKWPVETVCFAIYRAQKHKSGVFSAMAKKTPDIFDLGGIFAYHLFEYSNGYVLRIFEKAGNK
jgi:hypothetical protein